MLPRKPELIREFSTGAGSARVFNISTYPDGGKLPPDSTGAFPPDFPGKHRKFSTALRSFHAAPDPPAGIHSLFHRLRTAPRPQKPRHYAVFSRFSRFRRPLLLLLNIIYLYRYILRCFYDGSAACGSVLRGKSANPLSVYPSKPGLVHSEWRGCPRAEDPP